MKSWFWVACCLCIACGDSDPGGGTDRIDASVMPNTTGGGNGGGNTSGSGRDGGADSGSGNGTSTGGTSTGSTGTNGSNGTNGSSNGGSTGSTGANTTGTSSGGPDGGSDDGGSTPPQGLTDYREMGPQAVSNEVGTFTASGCSVAFEAFKPATAETNDIVMLAPGFALLPGAGSSREALIPFAKHIASWGITTYTVALCTNGASIDHPGNGKAMAEFGDSLAPAKVIYAGFSAGGLGTVIAASQAQGTAAFFGLDAVDTNTLAAPALEAITAPRYALSGEPSSCNSDSNMLSVYSGKPVRVIKVIGAQHFVFEGSVCEGLKCLACNGGTEDQVTAVRALTTAFARHVFALDAAALSWWDPAGEGFALLEDAGLISNVQ